MSCDVLAVHSSAPSSDSLLHRHPLASSTPSPPSAVRYRHRNVVASSRHTDTRPPRPSSLCTPPSPRSPALPPTMAGLFSTECSEGGLTISFNGTGADLHPLTVKRKLTERRHSIDLHSLTTGGFVPFQPEVLVSSRRSSLTEGCGNSRKLFSDEEIDRLSALYSSNFDPKKSPPKRRVEDLAARLGVCQVEVVRESEDEGIKTSRSDSDLFRAPRRASLQGP